MAKYYGCIEKFEEEMSNKYLKKRREQDRQEWAERRKEIAKETEEELAKLDEAYNEDMDMDIELDYAQLALLKEQVKTERLKQKYIKQLLNSNTDESPEELHKPTKVFSI